MIDVHREKPHKNDRTAHLRDAIDAAVTTCTIRGARLTPLRIRVFELVAREERPVKAYELLAILREERSAAPPTIYRALDFLMQQGLVHRIAAQSTYVISRRPGDAHRRPFLVCERCNGVTELANELTDQILESEARSKGFRTTSKTMEVHGICASCHGSRG